MERPHAPGRWPLRLWRTTRGRRRASCGRYRPHRGDSGRGLCRRRGRWQGGAGCEEQPCRQLRGGGAEEPVGCNEMDGLGIHVQGMSERQSVILRSAPTQLSTPFSISARLTPSPSLRTVVSPASAVPLFSWDVCAVPPACQGPLRAKAGPDRPRTQRFLRWRLRYLGRRSAGPRAPAGTQPMAATSHVVDREAAIAAAVERGHRQPAGTRKLRVWPWRALSPSAAWRLLSGASQCVCPGEIMAVGECRPRGRRRQWQRREHTRWHGNLRSVQRL